MIPPFNRFDTSSENDLSGGEIDEQNESLSDGAENLLLAQISRPTETPKYLTGYVNYLENQIECLTLKLKSNNYFILKPKLRRNLLINISLSFK